jgi:uncharacterized membrane protein YgaE (UPF0421/DUF939 family)
MNKKRKQTAKPTYQIVQKDILHRFEEIFQTYQDKKLLKEFLDQLLFDLNKSINKLSDNDLDITFQRSQTWQVTKMIRREVNKILRLKNNFNKTYYISKLLMQLAELKSMILDKISSLK